MIRPHRTTHFASQVAGSVVNAFGGTGFAFA
jgi:hypothetical protein